MDWKRLLSGFFAALWAVERLVGLAGVPADLQL